MDTRAQAVVDGLLADLPTGDPRVLAERFTADAVYQVGPGMPLVQGRSAIAAELARQLTTYSDLAITTRSVVADGAMVCTERVDEFTLAHNGVRATNPVVAVFEVTADGLIAAWREYWDALSLGRFMTPHVPAST
jgi:limonene-1,2-epoxide hydrolase